MVKIGLLTHGMLLRNKWNFLGQCLSKGQILCNNNNKPQSSPNIMGFIFFKNFARAKMPQISFYGGEINIQHCQRLKTNEV